MSPRLPTGLIALFTVTPPLEDLGFQRSTLWVNGLFDDLILIFFLCKLITWLFPISIPVIYANKICHYFHLC